jgi:hypothetical protein
MDRAGMSGERSAERNVKVCEPVFVPVSGDSAERGDNS